MNHLLRVSSPFRTDVYAEVRSGDLPYNTAKHVAQVHDFNTFTHTTVQQSDVPRDARVE